MEPSNTEIRTIIVGIATDLQKSAGAGTGQTVEALRKDAERLLEWCRELEKKKK